MICDSCASSVRKAYDDWHGGGFICREKSESERARKNISEKLRLKIYRRDGYRCCRCGSNDLTIDHIIPVSKGGTNEDKNLRTMCRICNSKKGTKIE